MSLQSSAAQHEAQPPSAAAERDIVLARLGASHNVSKDRPAARYSCAMHQEDY